MISGNVPINSQAVIQSANNGTDILNASFASRLVKHSVKLNMATAPLAETMTRDLTRERLFKEVEKDGGESSFKRLLARLADLRPAQARNNVGSGSSSPPSDGGRDVSGKAASDRSRRRSSVSRNLTPISRPLSINKGLIPDDLSPFGDFVRVGAQFPGFLVERGSTKENTIYRFRNRHALGPYGPTLKASDNIELSNCFYPISKGENLAGSPWEYNPELANITGAYMNACDGLGKHYYNGEFDISIRMKTPGNVTVFRLMPHSDGLQYIDSSNKIQKWSIDNYLFVDGFIDLQNSGAKIESPGDSPLTMRVEYRDGKHFFTVKTRSDYSTFKSTDNHCDIPLKITGKALGEAKCCTDRMHQRQDVKYIYVEPLRQGWFHVRFNVEFSDYSGSSGTGSPFTAFNIDDEEGVISHGAIGNNNRDSEFEPSGYHAQFGISEASQSSVFMRVKNPRFDHARRQNPQWPDWVKTVPQPLNGECQSIPLIANNLTSQVSKSELRRRLEDILTFGPRDNDYDSTNAAYKAVVTHVRKLLKEMGVTIAVQKFSYGDDQRDFRNQWDVAAATPKGPEDKDCNPVNNNSCNLCALIPGKTNNFIVAGAHLDTVKNSPGANDNGSSVVALFEAIRIFKQSKLELNNPVLFCFWGSEELSTNGYNGIAFGSRFFLHNNGYESVIRSLVKRDPRQGLDGKPSLQCYLNLELVGTKKRMYGESVTIGDPRQYAGSSPDGTRKLSELYAEFLDSKNINYAFIKPRPDWTDVGSFYHEDIPALTITAGPHHQTGCYHKACDDISEVDFDVLSNITQTVIYALTKLSLGEGISSLEQDNEE